MLRLLTIPISHYCEKARWALDRAGIAYREERHVQGVHQLMARRAGGGDTVPVLVTPDGPVADSADILDWVEARAPEPDRLFPADRGDVDRICARVDAELGPHGRRLIYVHMLAQPALMLRFNNAGVPRWEDRLLRLGWPVAGRYATRRLDISPGIEEQDKAVVWRELDFVAGLLEDGRPFLSGERFGAADLTFAALAAAVVLPPQYGCGCRSRPSCRPPPRRSSSASASTRPAASPCGCSPSSAGAKSRSSAPRDPARAPAASGRGRRGSRT